MFWTPFSFFRAGIDGTGWKNWGGCEVEGWLHGGEADGERHFPCERFHGGGRAMVDRVSVFSWTTFGLDRHSDIGHIFYSFPPFYYCSLPCEKDMVRHSIFDVLFGRGKI